MGFFRQGHWCGWPFPSPGDHLDPGIEPGPPTLWPDSLPLSHPGSSYSLAYSSIYWLAGVGWGCYVCLDPRDEVHRPSHRSHVLLCQALEQVKVTLWSSVPSPSPTESSSASLRGAFPDPWVLAAAAQGRRLGAGAGSAVSKFRVQRLIWRGQFKTQIPDPRPINADAASLGSSQKTVPLTTTA